jgi:hypothetical protein
MASVDRRYLKEIAQAEVPGLIEEARVAARVRVRAALEDALVEEMLKAAQSTGAASGAASGAGAAPGGGTAAGRDVAPGRDSAPAQSQEPSGEAWWMYCVVRSDEASELAAGLTGVQPGGSVEALVEGELAALLSRVPLAEFGDERLREHLEDLAWLEQTARAHEAVQEAVMERSPLVPLRLCTIYRDLDGARRMLRENADLFVQNLSAVQGCAEWGVKVFLALAARPEPTAKPATASTGADYLADRQRERDLVAQADELAASCTDEVHRTVSALARQGRLNPVQRAEAHGREAEMLLNGAYLVETHRVDELQSTISQLHEDRAGQGFLVELTGPWPPYNFVSDSAGMIS